MEIIRAWGSPIGCECGGAASCGMCHVEIANAWRNKLPPRSELEEAKLDELPLVTPRTRLACQILWRDELDGLEVELAKAAQPRVPAGNESLPSRVDSSTSKRTRSSNVTRAEGETSRLTKTPVLSPARGRANASA
jgi:2Fe-2S ferredoxin